MGEYTSYWLYQKYETRGDQAPIPVYPNTYSVDGDGTMNMVVKIENDPACGYEPTGMTQYRWVNIPITQDYICDECPIFRWQQAPATDYTCSGTTKYYKEYYQVSYDGGITWENVQPEQWRQGAKISDYSVDCGYIPLERWVNSYLTTCIEEGGMYNKYYLYKKQLSYDNGTTWEDAVPYTAVPSGDSIDTYSTLVDCESSTQHRWVQTEDTICVQGEYSKQSLTIIPKGNGSIKFVSATTTYYYSMDNGSTWIGAYSATTIPMTANTPIMFKGTMTPNYSWGIGRFSASTYFDVEGNIMSLLYSDNFEDQTNLSDKDYAFQTLFYSSKLISAENLILPATTLSERCYYYMFGECKSLTKIPELPATTLAESCYMVMFSGCDSLTTAPVLSATTLAVECYLGMFAGCTSLTTAPELPATTLAEYCYSQMFQNCTSLTTAPELSSTTLAGSCYYRMFQNCTSLVTAPVLPAITLESNCYLGMFADCTSFTTAPDLQATVLKYDCYYGMFSGCTSLVTPPVMSATTTAVQSCYEMFKGCTSLQESPVLLAEALERNCYSYMFQNCTSLNKITCLATYRGQYSTVSWVSGVAANGTFTKASGTTWSTGVDGIPYDWSIQNA